MWTLWRSGVRRERLHLAAAFAVVVTALVTQSAISALPPTSEMAGRPERSERSARRASAEPGARRNPPAPWPGKSWLRASPESQSMSTTRLDSVSPAIGAAVVVRNGYRVRSWGDAEGTAWWASVARSFVTTAYGLLIQDQVIRGGPKSVDGFVRSLRSATAKGLPHDVRLKHLLSYTACSSPPGTGWQYSCLWPQLNRILGELAGTRIDTFVNEALVAPLGGNWTATIQDDETLRVLGSPADLARWGYLWLRGGRWEGHRLAPRWFVRMSTRPLLVPDRSEFVEESEGWQIHLNRLRLWSGCPRDAYAAVGGDGAAIILVVPSRDLVVARVGGVPKRRHYDDVINLYLTPICKAARTPR